MSGLLTILAGHDDVAVGASPPGGVMSVSGPVANSADLGAISAVVFGALAHTTVTGFGAIGARALTWDVNGDSESHAVAIEPGPPSTTVRSSAHATQPNGSPWDWAAVNALITGVTAECVIAFGESASLVATRFVEVYGVGVSPSSVEMVGRLGVNAEGVLGEVSEGGGALGESAEGVIAETVVAGGVLGVKAEGRLRTP